MLKKKSGPVRLLKRPPRPTKQNYFRVRQLAHNAALSFSFKNQNIVLHITKQ